MGRRAAILAGALAIAVWAGALPAETPTAGYGTDWAYRAARADAATQLAGKISRLNITPDKTVGEFTGGCVLLPAALEAFAAGAAERGKPATEADGSCRVELEVSLAEIVIARKYIHENYAKGSSVSSAYFDRIAGANRQTALTAAGTGKVRSALLSVPRTAVGSADFASPSLLTGEARTFWEARVARPGRSEAVRAAREDARRRLAVRIGAVEVDAGLTIGQMVRASGRKDVDLTRFLRGARETGVAYHADAPVVEVEITLPLRKVYMDLKSWARANLRDRPEWIARLERRIIRSDPTVIREIGLAAPTGKAFQPPSPEADAFAAFVNGAPPWVSLKATRSAHAASEMTQALRLASIDAWIALARQVDALPVESRTTVGDLAADSEAFGHLVRTVLQSATTTRQSGKAGAGVTVSVELRPLWNAILQDKKVVFAAKP